MRTELPLVAIVGLLAMAGFAGGCKRPASAASNAKPIDPATQTQNNSPSGGKKLDASSDGQTTPDDASGD